MPLLEDINLSAINKEDPQKSLESLARQLNEWARSISNERLTNIYNDNSGTPRIIIGVLPDGSTGIVISAEGVSVLSVFD